MEELYAIMSDFLEVEHNQESIICLLRVAEASYSDEKQTDAKSIANSAKFYLRALQEELRAAIGRLDSYIVERAKKR